MELVILETSAWALLGMHSLISGGFVGFLFFRSTDVVRNIG